MGQNDPEGRMGQKMTECMQEGSVPDPQQLEEMIKVHGAVLFGTGFVAQSFLRVLHRKGLDGAVEACIVSAADRDSFCGKRVWSLRELPRDRFRGRVICVCVHETLKEEVLRLLVPVESVRTVWIYPYLFRMAFGVPTEEGAIRLETLLQAQPPENHWISVRFAALADYSQGRGDGDGIRAYLKTQAAFSGKETAGQRMRRFFSLYEEMKNSGYRQDSGILIDRELRVIDGLHRIAAAVMCGVEQIPYRMTEKDGIYEELFPEENRVTPAAQEKAGLTAAETNALRDAKQTMVQKTQKGANDDRSGHIRDHTGL